MFVSESPMNALRTSSLFLCSLKTGTTLEIRVLASSWYDQAAKGKSEGEREGSQVDWHYKPLWRVMTCAGQEKTLVVMREQTRNCD